MVSGTSCGCSTTPTSTATPKPILGCQVTGTELASGSIRIHHPDVQRKVFDALGISPEEAEARFGFFLEAFKYGPPPHGGIAPGIDRILMKMLDIEHIRDVVAFPKTQSGADPLSGAPTPVDDQQLKILGLRTLPQ